MQILRVGAELFNVDRQTDLTKLIIFFRDFTKAYKKDSESKISDGQMGKLSVI